MAPRKQARRATAKAAAGTPFDAIKKDDVAKYLDDGLPDNIDETQKFIEGDHWQDGAGWVGPIPDQSDPDFGITTDLIKRAFTSRNVTREITKRHTRGVVGEEPIYGLAPRLPLPAGEKLPEAKEKERLNLEAALTEWMDYRGVHLVLQDAVANAVWSSRGPIRLYVPRGKLNDGIIPKMADLRTALSIIYVDAPDPTLATVYEDEDSKEQIGIVQIDVGGKLGYEVTYLGPDTAAPGEPPDPKNPRTTIIRQITDDDDALVEVEFGGRMTMYAIRRDPLITEQQNQMQRALNLCLSMIPRNVVTAGFLERIILNGLPPGHWETDTRGRKVKFIRDNWETGPGTTQWIRGLELPQKDGSVQLTTPQVTMREPSDTTPADNAKRAIYRDMLEEADQAHVLMTSEALPSGSSRVEGRSDFEVSLSTTKAPTNAAGRWLIEAVIGMAEQFMQAPGSILTDWRAQFECRVNTGPVPIELRKQVLAEYEANLISEETAQAGIGVVDVQAEADRILAQNGGKDFALVSRQTDIILKLGQAGASIDGAAKVVGMSDEDAAALLGTDTTPPPGTDPNAIAINGQQPPGNAPDNMPPAKMPGRMMQPGQGNGNGKTPNNAPQGGGIPNAGA